MTPGGRGGRLVIDALTMDRSFAGIGRQVIEIGRSLSRVELDRPLEVRCAAEVAELLRPEFPPGTEFRTPLRSRSSRLARVAYQQLVAPLRDPPSLCLVCTGDQAPLAGRARVLLVIHDLRRFARPETSRSRLEALFYRLIVPRSARRAEHILTVSEFSRGEIHGAFGDELRVTVVHSHPQARPRPAPPPGDPVRFLVVGALRPYKGLDTLIAALASMDDEVEVLCAGAGEGYEEAVAAEARRLGVSDRVRLLGWVADGELEELYASCSATINPSTYEGYGLPVAESLARGIPTLASDIPAHREVADEAALYFEPGDPASLAAAMARVGAEERLRRELAERAGERARQLQGERGSWGELIAAWLAGTL